MINSNQRKVLIVGIIAIVVMGIFPPWTYTFKYESTYSEVPAGYSLIVNPPAPREEGYVHGVKLDISRLIIQWLIVSASTGLGLFLLSNKKGKAS
jgi:hypothetical protein